MSHIRILVSGIKKMLRELIIFLFLSIHCIVGQKGCVGVLTRGFDAIIEPPLCSSNNNNNNNNNNINNNNNNNSCNNTNNNNISVLWVLSYRNTKICYGNPKHYGSVNSNGSLVIHGSENYPLDSSSVTALVYDGNVLCNTSDFTIKLLPLYSFSGLHVEYPVQESNNFTIKFAGDPFVLCLSANTKGLSSNNRSTYWIRSRDKQKIYRESLSITNCTNCSCFINELKMRRGGKRTQSFLALYRTDPCYAVPNKLISVLYISTTQSMDNNSEFSFRYADIRGIGLPLASEGHFFRLSVQDYLMIDPLISVSPVNLTLSYKDTNGSVLCNGTTSVGEILEWKSADDNETVKWCVTNESCNCKGNESGTYQTLINKQIVSLSSSNSSSVLHTLIKLVICKSTANYAFKRYYCTVLNGSTHESVLVSYTDRPTEETPSSSSPPNQPTSTTVLYVLLTVSILLPLLTLFICIVIACIFCLKKRTKQEEMVQVLRGRVSLCSPTLYMKQQSILHADPLEFPREMLHFQNTIGEGQFGQVWKAQAVGIVPEDPSLNVVAVKTLKSDADFIDKEELLAELEIMKNLYPHPNILNLLGYCTVGGPCYIIMEFAMYGNLRDFLRSLKNVHSSSSSILAPFQSSSNHPMALNEGQTVDPWSLYNNIPIHYNTVLKQHLINTDYYNQHNNGIEDTQLINADTQMINADTQMVNADTQMVNADTQMIDVDTQMSNTDIEMTDADTHMINHPLLTEKDIFNFSLQISRGMEHLQSQKCIHRDLAARNVLIAEGQILKIADFGLAKELSSKDYYRRLSSGKLPARWMAVESLDDRQTHSHQSDIWSFGVVLWEICSYGDTPYKDHGIGNTLESLLLFIKNGNRLKRPENCSSDMYQLMLQCWNDDPKLRPNFNELVHKFDKLLSLAHGYLQMTSEN